jgi:anti-anti-sigma factor
MEARQREEKMDLSSGQTLLVERPNEKVWVVRFTRPDLRPQLDGAGVEDCGLFKDFKATVLDRVPSGTRIVLNLGLVLYFPTSFYQVMLQIRQALKEKAAKLTLCALAPEVQETLQVMRADKVFNVVHTEEQAVRKASRKGTTDSQ